MMVFFFSLEQPMAIPEGLHVFATRQQEPVPWVAWNGGSNFVSLRVWRPVEPLEFRHHKDDSAFEIACRLINTHPADPADDSPFVNVPRPEGEMRGTVVEAVTPLLKVEDGTVEMAISASFDRCLKELQVFMRAYFVVTGDARFRPISRQTCRILVPMTTQDIAGNYGPLEIFMVHEGVGMLAYAPEEVDQDQLHTLRGGWQRFSHGDPFAPFVERARVAHREYWVDGDYATTIIAAYTACEVLVNTALLMMAWEKGTDRDETRSWFNGQMGFMSRIGSQVVSRLGGNWGTQKPENPMSRLTVLSDLRNRVVHVGYSPEEQEAQAALATLETMEAFVKERVAANRMTYPRTALLLLGGPGLKRLGKWDKRMAAWMAAHADQEDDWITTFRNWRDASPTPSSASMAGSSQPTSAGQPP